MGVQSGILCLADYCSADISDTCNGMPTDCSAFNDLVLSMDIYEPDGLESENFVCGANH